MEKLLLEIMPADEKRIPEEFKKFKCYAVWFDKWEFIIPSHIPLWQVVKLAKEKMNSL